MRQDHVRQAHGRLDPTFVEIGLVQAHQRVGQIGVVVQVCVKTCLAITITVQHPPIVAPHARQNETAAAWAAASTYRGSASCACRPAHAPQWPARSSSPGLCRPAPAPPGPCEPSRVAPDPRPVRGLVLSRHGRGFAHTDQASWADSGCSRLQNCPPPSRRTHSKTSWRAGPDTRSISCGAQT